MKCFLIEPIKKDKLFLRRYASDNASKCSNGSFSYHNACNFIEEIEEKRTEEGYIEHISHNDYPNDPRWPIKCECGYEFTNDDKFQVFQDSVYQRTDTNEEKGLREWKKIPGAMWNAWWMSDLWKGPDGKCLSVVCPDGSEWIIDSVASNCDMLDKPHKCWIRHGEPPVLTVDKNGFTCSVGAGSIQTPNWHGFLRNGEFISC